MKNEDEAKKTIAGLEVRIEKALKCLRNTHSLPPELEDLCHLAPKGRKAHVSFVRSGRDREIRRIAPVGYWEPESYQVLIRYGRTEEDTSGRGHPGLGEQRVRIKGIPLSQTVLDERR